MSMSKHMTLKALLFAGALVLAAGCGKDIPQQQYSRKVGDPVVFGVGSSSEVGTRTAYREVTTYPQRDGKPIQPIDWVEGDKIRIYSPDAKCAAWAEDRQWADYSVKDVTADGAYSKGSLQHVDGQTRGLAWTDAGNHTFYGIYPCPAAAETTDAPTGCNGNFAYEIPAAQATAGQMAYAFMTSVAKANAGVSGDAVRLDFTPGFTAFEFQVSVQEATKFYTLEIESSSDPVVGPCTVAYGTALKPTYATTSTAKKVTFSFPNDATATVATGNSIKFRVFALPLEQKNLTIRFTVSAPGSTVTRTNSLALKYGSNPPSGHTTGEFLSFDPCKIHVFKAITTPNATRIIEVNSQVVDWSDAGGMVIDIP